MGKIQPQVLPQGLGYPAPLLTGKGLPLQDLIDQPKREPSSPGPLLDGGEPPLQENSLNLYAPERLHAITPKGSIVGKLRLYKSKCQEGNWLKVELGDRLRLLRKALGLSQAEFASKLGVKQRAISHWERGDTEPSFKTLQRISEIWSVNPVWLFKGEGSMFVHEAELSPDLAEALKNPRLQKILLLLKDLPEEEWEEVYRYLQKAKRHQELLKKLESLEDLIKNASGGSK